jgi:hypothetical protein
MLLALVITAGFGAPGAMATEYTLVNSVIGGGGGGTVSGGGTQLVGTVGQYAVGTTEGGEFSLMSGIGHDVYGVLWTEVGADVEQVSAIPKQYSLEQNFPNPFNPTTTIRFALRNQSTVDLSLYNILGQSVLTLMNGELPAGEYDVTLDATTLPTGVYFYRLTAGAFVQSRKLVILK